MDRLIIKISGRVQGVTFRQSAKEVAEVMGLAGVAKNLPDGQVEIDVAGPALELDKFLKWCHEGPSAAIVEQVEISAVRPAEFDGFRVE